MTRRDTCAQLGRLDRADGLTCTVCPTGPCWAIPARRPLLNRDHWLLAVCLLVLAALLCTTFVVGQQWKCERLADNPEIAAECGR